MLSGFSFTAVKASLSLSWCALLPRHGRELSFWGDVSTPQYSHLGYEGRIHRVCIWEAGPPFYQPVDRWCQSGESLQTTHPTPHPPPARKRSQVSPFLQVTEMPLPELFPGHSQGLCLAVGSSQPFLPAFSWGRGGGACKHWARVKQECSKETQWTARRIHFWQMNFSQRLDCPSWFQMMPVTPVHRSWPLSDLFSDGNGFLWTLSETDLWSPVWLGQAFGRKLSEAGTANHDQRTVQTGESKWGLASDLCLMRALLSSSG